MSGSRDASLVILLHSAQMNTYKGFSFWYAIMPEINNTKVHAKHYSCYFFLEVFLMFLIACHLWGISLVLFLQYEWDESELFLFQSSVAYAMRKYFAEVKKQDVEFQWVACLIVPAMPELLLLG